MKEFYISDACLPLTVALGYREQYTISSFKFDEIVPLSTLIREKINIKFSATSHTHFFLPHHIFV